jgi:hypothetical protein
MGIEHPAALSADLVSHFAIVGHSS